MTTRAAFVAHIQVKLPYAKLILQKKPGPLFDWHSCALTAVSLGDPSRIFSQTFDEGLDKAPLDEVVKTFVANALRALNGHGGEENVVPAEPGSIARDPGGNE